MERSLAGHLNRRGKLPNKSPASADPSPGLPRAPVLPPISSNRDKAFLDKIERFIKTESEKLRSAGQCDVEEQYIIHAQVFDKVIEYCKDYRPILSAIKREYDEFIDALKQGQIDAAHLQGKLKSLAAEPTTLMYYKKRAAELTQRIEIIENDSRKLERQIQKIQEERRVKSPDMTDRSESGLHGVEREPYKPIPGLTIEDSFDMEALTKYQQQLEEKMQTLEDDIKTKYVPAEIKKELDEKLILALQERDKAELINQTSMARYRKKRIIVDTITSWAKSDKSVTLYEAISQAVAKENAYKDDTMPANVFDDTDPRKGMEAEALLEYVERFNELFASGRYKAAATFAANSPRGILRNLETMERFKAVATSEELVSPLLLFFEALIGSSCMAKHPVNAILTLEGVKCALSQNKVDLVVHWVTYQRITFSEALGDVISEYGDEEPYHKYTCLALAQLIYRKCNNLRKAALCMCLQGQVQGALEYTYESRHFSLDDYLFLLKNCPTAELIHGLTKKWREKPAALSVGQAALSLIYTDHKEHGFQLLHDIHMCCESALEQVILDDVACTLEGWVEIASECSDNGYRELSDKILSIVTSQDGVVEISSKDEDAEIMEHVFL
ncbi:clathrin heavy chain linker domain-containing protein 1 [Spea bombifrons]|uniref:clathrin heavy chain linker domain-containing protein 1 n=1 Tax=Spea bombifrons TaxID=233779 RepID=UPI00234BC0C7|nr:clathrin heavy chain linker domain-containing protein 1 [Spea bombifrons]